VKSPGIKTMLADIRARHLARAVGDPLPGINAFAAPVFDDIAKALLDCTDDISRRLGFSASARK